MVSRLTLLKKYSGILSIFYLILYNKIAAELIIMIPAKMKEIFVFPLSPVSGNVFILFSTVLGIIALFKVTESFGILTVF